MEGVEEVAGPSWQFWTKALTRWQAMCQLISRARWSSPSWLQGAGVETMMMRSGIASKYPQMAWMVVWTPVAAARRMTEEAAIAMVLDSGVMTPTMATRRPF